MYIPTEKNIENIVFQQNILGLTESMTKIIFWAFFIHKLKLQFK